MLRKKQVLVIKRKYNDKMENGNKKVKKDHWSKTKVDSTIRKINNDIYKRNRQAPLQIKIDDLSIFINERITKRGIAACLVVFKRT